VPAADINFDRLIDNMKMILVAFCILFALQSQAQDSTFTDTSSVLVHKDPRLDQLVTRQAQINEVTNRDSRKTAKGFRLMIISTNNREEAIAAKTTVYANFPEVQPYLWHQSPYYKVKAGNFKDRKEAEIYQKKLSPYFPKGVFIMNDIIELKPEKMHEEEL